MIGTALNHYRITRALGSGGMGDVYEAEDTRLNRRVAVKVLPAAVAGDPERRQRFEREARAIAALKHPSIVTIHSIEQAGDCLFLTMELVEGPTLSQAIPPGGLPLAEFLQFAIPLADAISAAHRQGVIHRDLKPANIMVADGGVKILDFGLAQLTAVARDAEAVTMLQSHQLTADGSVIGTVAYMSPEQAQGLVVDERSDIFSLGIVLFEMASGERPFNGETPISILSSIVKDPAPSLSAVNPSVPGELARIVRRSLVKDRSRRYQTAADVRNDLEDVRPAIGSVERVPTVPLRARRSNRLREAIAWSLAAAAIVVALIAIFVKPRAVDQSTDVFSLLPPDKTTLTEGEAPQVSPDGRMIAFVGTDDSGRTRLYVHERGHVSARMLADTDEASLPFWSPESHSIGFFASGHLKRIAVSGGRPQTLAPAPVPRGGTWSSKDIILFVPFPEQPPLQIPAVGGAATAVPTRADELRWMPSFLPDGRRYVYLAFVRGLAHGIHVGSLANPEATRIAPSNTSATYVASGHLLYRREESLVAQRFNSDSLQLEGAPATVADQVSFNPITQQTLSSASAHYFLAYLKAGQVWHLTWFDRTGRRLSQAGTIGGYNSLCLSSDGRRVVYDLANARTGDVDLWSLDLTDGTTRRLTFEPTHDFYVVCSPVSDEVIFTSTRQGTPNPYRLALSSPGDETFLGASALPVLPSQWSGDGRLLFSAFSAKSDFDVWMLPLPNGKPVPLVATDAAEKGAQLSPNSRWVAYASGNAGNYDVYVQSFPATGSRWQISQGGGRQPQWRPDGRQLFYISPEKKLVAVDVDGAGSKFVVGASRVLVDTRVGGWERTHLGNPYAVSADGERLLVANAADNTLPMTVVVNWGSMVPGGR